MFSRTFFVILKFPGPIVLQTFEFGKSIAQPYCICSVPIGPIYKSESRDSLFQKRANKIPANFLEPHGPSMYTLSMSQSPLNFLVLLI